MEISIQFVLEEFKQGQVATLRIVPQACNCFFFCGLLNNRDHMVSSDVKRPIVSILITVIHFVSYKEHNRLLFSLES